MGDGAFDICGEPVPERCKTMRSVKVLPLPGDETRSILPPMAIADFLQMNRPSPEPANGKARLRSSACSNKLKMRSAFSAATPGPVSRTDNSIDEGPLSA